MDINVTQAREVLGNVDNVGHTVRGKLIYRGVGAILTLWGAIWIICFTTTHFAPAVAGMTWLVGDIIGLAGTVYFGFKYPGKRVANNAEGKRQSRRVFWFWVLLSLYANMWIALFWPWQLDQLMVFLVTVIMFAYVMMGLWLEMRFMLVLGLAVTALAVIGYFASATALPGYLNLWLAASGGGALLGSGLYLLRRWS